MRGHIKPIILHSRSGIQRLRSHCTRNDNVKFKTTPDSPNFYYSTYDCYMLFVELFACVNARIKKIKLCPKTPSQHRVSSSCSCIIPLWRTPRNLLQLAAPPTKPPTPPIGRKRRQRVLPIGQPPPLPLGPLLHRIVKLGWRWRPRRLKQISIARPLPSFRRWERRHLCSPTWTSVLKLHRIVALASLHRFCRNLPSSQVSLFDIWSFFRTLFCFFNGMP